MSMNKWLTACLLVGLVGIGLAGLQAYRLVAGRNASVREAKRAAAQEAARAADEIDEELRRCATAADALAGDLASGALSDDGIADRLRAIVEEDPEILTVGVAYHPSTRGGLHAPAVTRAGESTETLQLHEVQDYTAPGAAWYHEAIQEGRGWREPSWSEIEESMTVVYSAPFFRPRDADASAPTGEGSMAVVYSAPFPEPGDGDSSTGVVFVSLSLDRMSERVDELDTGSLGWGGILSREGHYLVHPNEQRVEDPATLPEVLHARGDDEYLATIRRALDGERVTLERTDTTTGQTAWFFHEPVEQTGWSVVLVRFEDEILATDRPYRRRVIGIVVTTLVGLIGVATWLAGGIYRRRSEPVILWVLVGFTSLAMLLGLQAIRLVTYDQVSDEDRETVRLFDEDSLSSYVRSQRALWISRHEAPPITVPTGILVRTLAFRGAKEVFVSGVVWQKLADGTRDTISEGVDFPDAIQYEISEVFRRRRDHVETVGWRFEATLRQVMDLSRYPLDHDDVSIRLLPRNYDSRVLLVPDLASYTLTNRSAKPGLEEIMEVSGWRIVGSYFDFKYGNYNTDLGIPDYEGEESLPELHFSIELKRNVLNALIANMIPIMVVLLMLFAVIVKRTDDVDESKLYGFNPSGTVRICSALFFVVLLAHIQLRNSLQVEEVVLFEYMYFIVYLAILFTALHTFLFFSKVDLPIIRYKASLIVKLLFWPVVLGLQLLVSVVLLY